MYSKILSRVYPWTSWWGELELLRAKNQLMLQFIENVAEGDDEIAGIAKELLGMLSGYEQGES